MDLKKQSIKVTRKRIQVTKKKNNILILGLSIILLSLTTSATTDYLKLDKLRFSEKASAEQIAISVDSLCRENEFRTWNNPKELNRAGNYIYNTLSNYSNNTVKQTFSDKRNEYFNVISSFGPEDAPRLIIGAHYDVCGNQQGADDNASGVSSLIELARLLDANYIELNYRIDLVAYTLEEPPFFRSFMMGSAVHARSLKKDSVDVIGMISLEMLGFYSEERGSQRYPASIMKLVYPSKANYISLVTKFGEGKFLRKVRKGLKSQSEVNVRSVSAPAKVPGIDYSDHKNYWENGFSALMITDTSFYRNSNYHISSDIPSTLNYNKIAGVTNGVFQLILNFNA